VTPYFYIKEGNRTKRKPYQRQDLGAKRWCGDEFIFNGKLQHQSAASFGCAISFPFPLLHFYYIISPLLLSLQQHLLFTLHLPRVERSVSRPLASRQVQCNKTTNSQSYSHQIWGITGGAQKYL